MPGYYPAFLDLHSRRVVVVGGGPVAQRKVASLLETGANITVISPQLTAELERSVDAGKVTLRRREYRAGDMEGAYLAIIATDDRDLNRLAASEARAAHVLVNTVDDVTFCDFIAPAVVQRGEITLAVSTNGKSPAMARFLRTRLEEFLTSDYADLLEVLERVRRELRRRGANVDPERWQEQIDDDLRGLIGRGDLAAAEQRLLNGLLQSAAFPKEETIKRVRG